MEIASKSMSAAETYRLLISTIVPRPIAFVTSVSASGVLNAAPFSFFNAMGSAPPIIAIGFEPKLDGSDKDTPRNIHETGEFVVNIVDEPLASQMNICAGNLAPNVNELDVAKLETAPAKQVKPPVIPMSPVSMECKMINHMRFPAGNQMIVGEILHFHLRDDVIAESETLQVDIDQSRPIARLSGAKYARISDQFIIKRPA